MILAPRAPWIAARPRLHPSGRISLAVLLSLGVLLGCGFVGLAVGGIALSPEAVWTALTERTDGLATTVVWNLRLPRILLGVAAGAALGVSGSLMQALTRNPLADPTLTGVTSGAALAVVAAFVLVPGIPVIWHPALALAGGFIAAGLCFALAWRDQLSPLRLALAGLSVATFGSAATTAILVSAGPQAGPLFFWLAGGLMGRGWLHLQILLPWAVPALLLALFAGRALNVMALGDEAAQALGLNLPRWRLLVALLSVVLAAAVVSVAGPIGFVGLTAPHLARFVAGPDARRQLPLAALFGATLVVAADLVARTIAAPRELPVGFLTVVAAAPWLIALTRRSQGGWGSLT